jgi:Flp pilus assembly protein TadB
MEWQLGFSTGYDAAKMRGAKITVKCDCGEVAYLDYGESWQCSCGRRWNTRQIPAEEYWGMMQDARAQRLRLIGLAVAVAAAFGVVAFRAGPRAFAAAPLVIGFWYLVVMPRWRRRLRQRTRALPKWTLTPE